MSDEGVTADWICRECGRANRLSEPRCGFCSAPRPGATGIAAQPGPPRRSPAEADEDYPRPAPLSPFYWQLPVVTANCILIACMVLILAYGVGLALLVALIPALHHLFLVGRERSPELSMLPPAGTAGRSFSVIVGAVGITLLVVISSAITFVAVCFPTGAYALLGPEPTGFPTQAVVWTAGLLGGMALAGGAGYGIVYASFPRKKG